MPAITPELLRKHAEHNDRCLETLEEISLNQLHVTSGLDAMNSYCPNLKIVYLQGNLIDNLGRTGRLKKLEYLNVALNNLKDVRGLEKCESLKKLDLTLNFIASPRELLVLRDLPLFEDLSISSSDAPPYIDKSHISNCSVFSSSQTLHSSHSRSQHSTSFHVGQAQSPSFSEFLGDLLNSALHKRLRSLYTSGNPCENFPKYHEYVLAILPALKWLNGKEIRRSERIRALSAFESGSLGRELETWEKSAGQSSAENFQSEDSKDSTRHDPDGRKKAKATWLEMQEKDQPCREDIDVSENQPSKTPQKLFKSDGVTALNVNKAKIPFKLTDQGDHMLLTVGVYKYLDTSLIDVNVDTTYVRVTLKDEVLQLRLEQEVLPDSSSVARCPATGELTIKMPKVHQTIVVTQQKATTSKPVTNQKTTIFSKKKPHWRDMLKIEPQQPKICEKVKGFERPDSPNFEDDPSVPPLE